MTYLLIAIIQKQYEERDFEANFIWRIANPTRHKKPIEKHAGFNKNNIDNLTLPLEWRFNVLASPHGKLEPKTVPRKQNGQIQLYVSQR